MMFQLESEITRVQAHELKDRVLSGYRRTIPSGLSGRRESRHPQPDACQGNPHFSPPCGYGGYVI